MTFYMVYLIGLKVITKLTNLDFAWKLLLGALVSVALLQWLSQFHIHLYWLFILSGLQAVLCTLGLVILADRLVCSAITSYSRP